MKKLIWLAILLPTFANAQWVNGVIQRNGSNGSVRYFQGVNIDTLAKKSDLIPGLQDSLTKKANRTFDNVASGAIANVKLANSTISGVALGSNLNTLTLGNGLTGTSYNGSSAITARADTAVVQTVSNFFPKGDTRYQRTSDRTTVGNSFYTLTNPSAITFPRINANNTVSALSASDFRTAIGAGTSSTTGTVTSVAATVPTGLTVSGSPITSSGTLAIGLQSGYSIPTTAKQGQWDTAYGWGNPAGVYLPLTGGTLTGNLIGTVGTFNTAVYTPTIATADGTKTLFNYSATETNIHSRGTGGIILKSNGNVTVGSFSNTGSIHGAGGLFVGTSQTDYSGRFVNTGSYMVLDTWDGSSMALPLRLQGSAVQLYGALMSDQLVGSGNVIVYANNSGQIGKMSIGSGLSFSGGVLSATGGSSGTVTGSGTAGKIAVWNSASDIGDSPLTVTGSNVSASGKITIANIDDGLQTASSGGVSLYGNEINAGAQGGSGVLHLGYRRTTGVNIYPATTFSSSVTASSFTGAGTGLTGTASGLNIGGNAATATALQTARTINGVSFNGTANISIGTTVGQNFIGLTNPSAITFPRINANNTVSALSASDFRTAIGAGTSSTTGTVTSVAASGGTGISISGSPITTSGTITITNTAPNATHTGDVTGSTALTIANSAVTLAKMANVATSTVFYRKTAGTGAPEVQTLATLKTDLGLSGTNTGDQTNITGNAGTATKLATARTIAGVSFDGTANISLNNNAITNGAGYITSSAITGKEDAANKSTSTSLGTSNTLYPSQNAVKTYVDNEISNHYGTVGELVFSGDGSTTAFNTGLVAQTSITPLRYLFLMPKSNPAAYACYLSTTHMGGGTYNWVINFIVSPPSGSNNVSFNYLLR